MILEQIINYKKKIIDERKNSPLSAKLELTDKKVSKKEVKFSQAIKNVGRISLIAEVKKASPSKGIICKDFNPLETAKIYQREGASAVSVLTDEKFFQGSSKHLSEISGSINLPVLRKDFIIDQYQIYESYLLGADAILLIASILSQKDLRKYLQIAASLDMDCLVEIHNGDELEKVLDAGAGIIGINNRNLHTFQTDLQTTFDLMEKINGREGLMVVSESGINSSEDIKQLLEAGVNAVLVGEALMKSSNVGKKISQLLGGDNCYG